MPVDADALDQTAGRLTKANLLNAACEQFKQTGQFPRRDH